MTAEQHYNKGKAYLKERVADKALDCFNYALEINPDSPYILSDRGVAYFHLKKYDLAIIDMDKAVALQPENPYRYASRAYIRSAMGDNQGGVEDYKKTIALDPTDAIAHNNLGLLEEKMGYAKSAKDHFTVADQISEKDTFYGKLYGKTEKPTKVDPGDSVAGDDKVSQSSPNGQEVEENIGYWSLVFQVFKSKSSFKEFLKFLKNGFKLK
jgi:tetratricopeptide (TPR) repeat protein